MPRKAMKTGRRFEKKVEEIVRKELAEELEEKRAMIQVEDKSLNTVIASGNVSNNANFCALLPPIEQVVAERNDTAAAGGAYNFRVGDEINLKAVKIKGFVYMRDQTTDSNTNTRIGIRVMILKQKDKNSYAGFLADAHTNRLLLDSNPIGAPPGPGGFNGAPLDLKREINRNEFAVRYDKTFYLSRDLLIGSQSNSNRSGISSKDSLKFFEHTLTFGKGKKLTFTDGEADAPNEFPYVMVVGQTGLVDPTTSIPDGLGKMTYTATAIYTDA